MMRPGRLLAPALLCLMSPLWAADVRVSQVPKAVFTPSPGGFILRQPGPAYNLSTTPQPVTPPSSGIPGRGTFSGGQKFRVNLPDFEMGAEYDMPIPKTGQKAPVTAITKIPKVPLAKSLLKMVPIVGNLYAAGQLLDDMAAMWDAQEPGGAGTVVDKTKGTVTRTESPIYWEIGGKRGSSAAAACNAYYTHVENTAGGPVTRTATADLLDAANETYACRYSHMPAGSYLGSPGKVVPPPVTRPVPSYISDQVAETMTDQQTGDLLNEMQSSPNASKMELDIPADSPTTVTGPASVPSKTTTTNNSDGSTTTSTTTTNINYTNNEIKINQQTTVTNTASDGTQKTTTTTETDLTPPTDPNPDETPPADTPGLCDLFPDILACKKLEEPAPEEIPKRDQNITLQTGPTFAGGACPPDVIVNVGGRQVTVLATAAPCGWIESYMKPIILLLASLSAVFIVLPRGGD